MASVKGLPVRWSRLKIENFRQFPRNFSTNQQINRKLNNGQTYWWYLLGGSVCAGAYFKWQHSSAVTAFNPKKMKDDTDKGVKLTSRERRFIKFASVEFDGQLYMTPQDFLDSVVEQEARPRLKRRTLTLDDINKMKDATPPLKKGSTQMFRTLRDKGIISYTEYLFLLSILTKPKSGFKIAFNMFDTDGNQRVDKNEFLVITRILGGSLRQQHLDRKTQRIVISLLPTEEATALLRLRSRDKENDENRQGFMENIFIGAWRDKRGIAANDDTYVEDEEGLQRRHKVDTTLQVHFFGKKGNQDLHYEGFYKFMDNLQTEVLELEFYEFSKGNIAITEVDFAKILLRYTYLDTDEYDMYLDRLLDRVKHEKGVTFKEFKDFCQFLNNLEDFSIAMRMYTLSDQAISKGEFARAVKICTGLTLSEHLVDTVFAIFDEDGDGMLSYKEFIAIMKDRLHRGFKSVAKSEGWEAFKHCLKQEMKAKF
ncbi:calcium uptake protein 3, mitochondrial isoform X2 [Sitodiplosis mosellana]|uniref:calcium uptake protein 3, mitochondrial isoform X2 n=1 Tax=Sitodiplosis mosellana TaxID=263140 RepID=UPI00244396A4|nr:calcium uptake protein 3, mitochondrial isoform X2 [Sitodiplosis mosellana]